MTLPKLSIAAKLYAIFALMATVTVALSVLAVSNARQHAALTDEFESTNAGSRNVERINGLIYAVMGEARGIYLAKDGESAARTAVAMTKVADQIGAVTADWQGSVRTSDASIYSQFAVRLSAFQVFVSELAQTATDSGPIVAREWADKNYPADVRAALTQDLAKLGKHYSDRAARIYKVIDEGIDRTAILMSLFAAFAVLLAVAGAVVILRSVARPLAYITRVTEQVAAGETGIAIPFSKRRDEIGALSRSIGVF